MEGEKKIVNRIISLLIIIAVLLSACTGNGKEENGDGKQEHVIPDGGTGTLKVALGNLSAATSSGLYELLPREGIPREEETPYSSAYNILYTDFETGKTVYLCNVPGCAHNSEDCTAYMECSQGVYMMPDFTGEHIIFAALGTRADITSKKELPSVMIMDRDGSDRRELCRLKADEVIEGSVFFVDERYLYFLVDVMSTREIRRIDLDTGECDTIFTTVKYMHCIACRGNEMILLMYDSSLNDSYMSFSPYTMELREVQLVPPHYYMPVITPQYSVSFYYKGHEEASEIDVVAFDNDTGQPVKTIKGIPHMQGSLVDLNLLTDSLVELSYQYEDPEEREEAGNGKYLGGPIHWFSWIIDLDSGTYCENKLTYKSKGDSMEPMPVVAETGDGRLLVVLEDRDCTVTLTDYQGIPHLLEIEHPGRKVYGLISAEDFFAGIPDYHEVQTAVYSS